MKVLTTGRLTDVERLRSTPSGNPRYKLTLDGNRDFMTSANGSVNYDVPNYRIGRQVELTLELTKVIDLRYTDGSRP